MDEVDFHSEVGDALALLIDGLSPFVERGFATKLPPGVEWTLLLERKDKLAGRRGGVYSKRDLSLLLRALTERLGDLGYPFDRDLPRQGQNYASELREVRNLWAHNGEFSAQTAFRAMDSAGLLLEMIGAPEQASQIAVLKTALLPPRAAGEAAPPTSGEPVNDAIDEETTERIVVRREPSPLPRPAPTVAASAGISIKSVSHLSYAMAHCRIPVIDEIAIENRGGERRGASLEIDVVSAEGSLGGPKVLIVDLGEGQTTTLRSVDLVLDPAHMLAVDEQRPGLIRATLRDAAGELIVETSVDVQILASNQWIATPLHLGLELLAAHVQPNAAAIAPLLVEASDRLKSATGKSALDGYQSENPERVDAIVTAVYDAMRARDIRYAEPPASWDSIGQKVRTPGEVLEGRLGTCLDTTVTLAAVLEQAGINTTLWLLEGHIFLGYWRTDNSLGAVASTDVMDVINLVDLGHLALVETTMLTGGDESRPFGDANRAPRTSHLADGVDRVQGVTDVRQARLSGIYPLPSRSRGVDGETIVTVYEPGSSPIIAPYYGAPAAGGTAPEPAAVPRRVQQWKNALLDLSLRNKLINYTDRSGYRLEVPPPVVSQLEDAVNAGTSVTLLASDRVQSVDEVRGIRFGRDLPEQTRELLLAQKRSAYIDITSGAYTSKLRYLAYKAKTIAEETGANNLYLAFGMLHWRVNDRDLRSPLVLVPVSLTTASRGEVYRLTLDESGASTPNYCLLEKLRVSFGLDIPGLQNPVEDESGIDLGAAFRAVREAIAGAGLPFRVEESVDLAILQFAKFRLWKDLDEHWGTLAENALVSHLIHTPLDAFQDPNPDAATVDLDELGAVVPVPADASQLEAVAEAVGGRTFVLEGPPGTGKSQTITNLLARSLAAGRRVLFVAEKRAALDVVKKRLESVGLGDFSLDLHDKSARPAAVRAQIKRALDLVVRTDAAALQANSEAAEASRRSLARYATRLHEANSAGMSLYSARTNQLAADPEIEALEVSTGLVASADEAAFAEVRDVLRRLPETADLARPAPTHPWAFIDERPPARIDARAVHAAARAFDAALDSAQQAGFAIADLGRVDSPDLLDGWAQLARAPRHPVATLDALQSPAWQTYLDELQRRITGFARPTWTAEVRPTVLGRDVDAIHAEALAADASSFFGRRKRRRAVLARFADELVGEPASVKLKTLSDLTGRIAATNAELGELRGMIAKVPVPLIDSTWNVLLPADVDAFTLRLGWVRFAARSLDGPSNPHVAQLRQYFSSTAAGAGEAELSALGITWRQLLAAAAVTPADAATWAGELDFLTRWQATRAARNLTTGEPVTLVRWLELVRHVEPLRRHGLDSARGAILNGRVPAEDAALAFDKGVALASIAEREDATALNAFDIAAHNKTIQRFTNATHAVRAELPRAIPVELLAGRTFAATSTSGQIGGLRRQLDRQRGGLSVRAMLEQYGDIITQVMPCTLMSPESVARFIPARSDLFDIVVFDEASQIRVADAVGAMGRGTSVVVVGDSKQMPPTSFADAGANLDEDTEYTPETVVDEESILTECVQAQVPSKWLSWHYRSQDESLIAFSNHHYYENRLSSFPAPIGSHARDTVDGHGISLVRVNGHFERTGKGKSLRTNRVEAEAIVEDVRRRFWASPDVTPSLGVITFNAPQRDLVENLLRDSDDDRIRQALDEPDGLFVKNLENVQGDERDCILFSVAFSVNANGVLPLNFGPLSRAGGERRLNVAVTRARRQVVLYASFDPEILRAEQTSSIGIKHLKAYLEMASRGVEAVSDDGRRQAYIDRHRDEIADELRLAGFAIKTDVGLSDFRVDISIAEADEPDVPLVAVLLDGPVWRARQTVADRDGLPVDVLKGLMRWPGVERVWLPEWLHHREETLSRLSSAVTDARMRGSRDVTDIPSAPPDAAFESTSVELEVESVVGDANSALLEVSDASSASTATPPMLIDPRAIRIGSATGAPVLPLNSSPNHPNFEEFIEWQPGRRGSLADLDALPHRSAHAKIEAAIRDAIATEGPMSASRLSKLVAGSFGLNRVARDRITAIRRVVPDEFRRRDGESTFYWPAAMDVGTWLQVRLPESGSSRAIDEVPLVEIANAMRIASAAAGGMNPDEVKREALGMFGGKRMTASVEARLDDGLAYALETGRLVRAASGVLLDGLR
ncbi:DUF4011 domain-containing protein [Agromyces sp. Leaf222]|uniref:DUF4011 domain-containing protein n=1 Tax=Agromyces sp. Leaf222 TaxID=1735688 RepID=UPI0006FDA937|nr:DUF4011 domain-containing protein [Agromyces sp. Leaf222]KQM81280.1 DNA helicase [Agromyces sp. Leaf222]